MLNSPRTLSAIALTASLGFTLACSSFMSGMEQGMEKSAREAVSNARTKLAANCPDGPNRAALEGALDKILADLDSGAADGLSSAFNAGLVQGAAEEKCADSSVEGIRSLAPELL